jgi:hypothetical protein
VVLTLGIATYGAVRSRYANLRVRCSRGASLPALGPCSSANHRRCSRAQDQQDTGPYPETPWPLPLDSTLPASRPTPGLVRHLSRLYLQTRLTMVSAGFHQADVQAAGSSGSGARFAKAVIIVAGVCALVASLVTFVCASWPIVFKTSADVVLVLFGYRRERNPRAR